MKRVLSVVPMLAVALMTADAAAAQAQTGQLPRCSDDGVVDAVAHVLAQHTAVPDKTADNSISNITEVGETQVSRTCNATVKAIVAHNGVMHFGGSEEATIEFTIAPSEKHGRFTGYVVSVNLID